VGNKTQNFTYDNRNRKTGMTWTNGADSGSFTYDDAGRLLTATNPNSTVTRTYDAAGRLTVDQQAVNGLSGARTANYWYDEDGKQVRMWVSSASYDYTFSYDAMGRFEKISPTGSSVAFQYYYDPASNETQRMNFLNGVTQLTPRDSLNRMSRRDVKKRGNWLSAEAYTYDRMNRLAEVNRGSVSDMYGYYWDGELEWAQYGVQTDSPIEEGQDPDLDTNDNVDPWANYQPPQDAEVEPTQPPEDALPDPALGDVSQPDTAQMQRWVSYFFDKAGNRQNVVDTGAWKNYVVNNTINQYNTAESISVTNGSEHEISAYNNVSYSYINDERLKSVSSSGNTYALAYDALGRCVKRTLNITGQPSVTTYYIYDGEKAILEYKSDDLTRPAKNLYGKGIDEILMRTETGVNGGQPFYYQQDHEGSVTHLTNSAGDVLDTYKYDAFGAPDHAPGFHNRFLFTGREYQSTFGFYEYRARAYHPGLGRFMSEDPKGFAAGDYNLFRYCYNDPLDLTDPMGLEGEIWLIRDAVAPPNTSAERRAPGAYIIKENGMQIYAGRANEHGFMKDQRGNLTRGIPKGDYTLQPKLKDGVYPAGQPAITGQGLKPGQPTRDYQPDSVLVHGKDPSGQPDSRGCVTCDQEGVQRTKEVMDRNLDKGGTKFHVVEPNKNEKNQDGAGARTGKPPDASQIERRAIQQGAEKAAEHTSNVSHTKPDPQPR
jgi:RHS repeat-associated protein